VRENSSKFGLHADNMKFNTQNEERKKYMYRSKAIPLKAWTDPEDSRKLRLRNFMTIGT
jgi:hypothetical protein